MKRRFNFYGLSTAIMVGALIALSSLPAFACEPDGKAAAVGAANGDGQLGRWLTESGNLEVEIAPCGDALCGTVVRVIANRSMSSPDKVMAPVDSRPALGMQILSNFTPSGGGVWQGQIYNRENGKTYDCLMELVAPDQLKIRGYKVMSLFGQTQIWRRVTDQAAR